MSVYHISRLENGLTVATAEMPHMRSVSVGLWLGIGARYEPAPLSGVCHFIEHLLFKGTEKRSAKEISQAVEGIGGYLNAFTSEETTCYHARACAERFEELLDVLMDMAHDSKFRPADIAKEREVIKEEMAMYLDEPQHQVQELLNATMWPGQPLGRSITGTNRTLDAMARPHLVGYLQSNYVAATTLVVAAGNLKHRHAVRATARYAHRFRTGAPAQFAPARNAQQAPRVRLLTKRTEQTQIALGIRTCSRHDRRRYALRLLSTVLGENMSSRLFQVIREDRALAYSIYSSPSFFHDTGDLVISAGLDTDNLPKTLRLVMRELGRLINSAPAAAELRRARDYVIGQIDLSLESTDSQMNWLAEQLLGYGRVYQPAAIKRRLGEVTPGEIRAVAGDFFRPERLNLALVSPLKKAIPLPLRNSGVEEKSAQNGFCRAFVTESGQESKSERGMDPTDGAASGRLFVSFVSFCSFPASRRLGTGTKQKETKETKDRRPGSTLRFAIRKSKNNSILYGAKILLDSPVGPTYIARSFGRKLIVFMRRPKGIKTKKSVAKRFKITARGKVLASSAGKRHLLQTKSPKRRRNLRGTHRVDPTDEYRVTQNLPFSH